ncbi:sensor histidine kinase [Algoriphagus litoralis]|uniref:sensor histidine kinase n=1 Tax=Algoriphagus litoralis TaxID=2202829 RepID=UPI0013007A1E|nr:histidine kinase [Algoriphagus litoralis]
MNRIEKIVPVILSLLLPGLSIISSQGDLDPIEVFPKYLLSVFFLYSIWQLNDYQFKHPDWLILRVGETKMLKTVFVLTNLLYISLILALDFFIFPSWISLSSTVPIWVVATRLTMAALIFAVFQQALKMTKQQDSLYSQNLLLQTEKLKAELESMKQQINPHFLFNSLNTLIDLIEEDQKKAVGFVRVFSNLYRVVLQSSRRDFVFLEDELSFLKDYWELLKIRFNGAVHLQVDIPVELRKVLIPPLSLQLLIENAVKHNQATNENPLRIEVFENKDTLVIQNNINPKPFVSYSEGLGLVNLQKRFSLLLAPIEYGENENMFRVILPYKKTQQ